jgi:regulator of protease activity HflC (stomatin/prohibitin superfamily)
MIVRADVKDLIFPGNLQDVMNKVLAAQRLSEAQMVEARTRADVQRIDAQAKAEARRLETEAQADALQRLAENEAEMQRIKTASDIRDLQEREQAAQAYTKHPALMRLEELSALGELARTANARIYINFDGHVPADRSAD